MLEATPLNASERETICGAMPSFETGFAASVKPMGTVPQVGVLIDYQTIRDGLHAHSI